MPDGVITALVTVGVPAIIGALTAGYRAAKAAARAEILQEQSKATVEAKNAELEEVKAENRRLWALLDGLTS